MAKDEEQPKAKWSDTRIVVALPPEVRVGLEMYAEAQGKSMAAVAAEFITTGLKKAGDYRKAAVEALTKRLGVSIVVEGKGKKAEAAPDEGGQ